MCRARWCHLHLTFCLFSLPAVTCNFGSNVLEVRQIPFSLLFGLVYVSSFCCTWKHKAFQRGAATSESPNNMDAFPFLSQGFFSFSVTSTNLHLHVPCSTFLSWIESNASNQRDAMQRLVQLSTPKSFFPLLPAFQGFDILTRPAKMRWGLQHSHRNHIHAISPQLRCAKKKQGKK